MAEQVLQAFWAKAWHSAQNHNHIWKLFRVYLHYQSLYIYIYLQYHIFSVMLPLTTLSRLETCFWPSELPERRDQRMKNTALTALASSEWGRSGLNMLGAGHTRLVRKGVRGVHQDSKNNIEGFRLASELVLFCKLIPFLSNVRMCDPFWSNRCS